MIKTFLNDQDGLTIKEYTVFLFVTTYVFLIFFAVYEWLQGKNIQGLLSILDVMTGVTIACVGGIFAMGSLQVYSQGKQISMSQQQMNPYNQYGGYSPYMNNYNSYNNYQPYQNPIISEEENVQSNASTTSGNNSTITKPPV